MKPQAQIKFRAWGPQSKHMVSPEIVSKWQVEELTDGRYLSMQFTGLLDKDGVEIYEGDILEHVTLEYRGKVVWPGIIDRGAGYDYLDIRTSYVEVIGNVYENPELLKTS